MLFIFWPGRTSLDLRTCQTEHGFEVRNIQILHLDTTAEYEKRPLPGECFTDGFVIQLRFANVHVLQGLVWNSLLLLLPYISESASRATEASIPVGVLVSLHATNYCWRRWRPIYMNIGFDSVSFPPLVRLLLCPLYSPPFPAPLHSAHAMLAKPRVLSSKIRRSRARTNATKSLWSKCLAWPVAGYRAGPPDRAL